jgi:plasmid stability protein
MKNLTVTLPDETLSRLRVAAAREGKSMSKFVTELLERRVGRTISQREALDRFLAGPPLPLSDENGKLPSRTELYDEHLLSRHERADLQPGSGREAEAGSVADVAERSDRDEAAGDQPAGHQRVLPRRAS